MGHTHYTHMTTVRSCCNTFASRLKADVFEAFSSTLVARRLCNTHSTAGTTLRLVQRYTDMHVTSTATNPNCLSIGRIFDPRMRKVGFSQSNFSLGFALIFFGHLAILFLTTTIFINYTFFPDSTQDSTSLRPPSLFYIQTHQSFTLFLPITAMAPQTVRINPR